MSRSNTYRRLKPKVLPKLLGYRRLLNMYCYRATSAYRDQYAFDLENETIIILYNDGKHLRASIHEQDPLCWLRFRDYCGDGARIGMIRIQHLGHLRGVNGGSARVIVNTLRVRWDIQCEPRRYYALVQHEGTEYLYMS